MKDITCLQPNIIIGYQYDGTLMLPAWKDFQYQDGDTEEKPLGAVKAIVEGCEIDYVRIISIQQVNAIKFLVENSEKVKNCVLDSLLNYLPTLKEPYKSLAPKTSNTKDLQTILSLSHLYIMSRDNGDYAYVGFKFECKWNEKNGVGIMTYKDRVLAVGEGYISWAQWVVAKDDGISTAFW